MLIETIDHGPSNIVGELNPPPVELDHQEPPRSDEIGLIGRSSRYLLYKESFDAVTIKQEEDTQLKDVIEDIDVKSWKVAMKSEMGPCTPIKSRVF